MFFHAGVQARFSRVAGQSVGGGGQVGRDADPGEGLVQPIDPMLGGIGKQFSDMPSAGLRLFLGQLSVDNPPFGVIFAIQKATLHRLISSRGSGRPRSLCGRSLVLGPPHGSGLAGALFALLRS